MTKRALAGGFCTSAVHVIASWQQLALQTQDLSPWYVTGRGNEGYRETVLMVKSVSSWSAGLLHTARMKLKEDLMFDVKEDTQDLAAANVKDAQ